MEWDGTTVNLSSAGKEFNEMSAIMSIDAQHVQFAKCRLSITTYFAQEDFKFRHFAELIRVNLSLSNDRCSPKPNVSISYERFRGESTFVRRKRP